MIVDIMVNTKQKKPQHLSRSFVTWEKNCKSTLSPGFSLKNSLNGLTPTAG